MLGVHTPETPGEAELESVRRMVKVDEITYPVAVDSGHATWNAWANRYWPSVYLIDKKGRVRYRWEGELESGTPRGEPIMRRRIEELLAEKG